jgi:hypothetical protein
MTKSRSPTAIAGLNRVLLSAALRAERSNADKAADKLAREVAELADELARQA